MKVTLIETFDQKWKLITTPGETPREFETTKQLSDFLEEKGIRVKVTFYRKNVPDSAIICYTPAAEWTEMGYNFNWWRSVRSKAK